MRSIPVSVRDALLRGALSLASPGSANRLSIVIFHRVHAQPDPLFPSEVTCERFDAICAWLAAWFHVLPLDEAVERLLRNDLPARALCITFDDGYADNHEFALPILRRHGLQATFFVASGFLDGGRMWNDTVIESVRRSPLPALRVDDLGLPDLRELPLGSVAQRRAAVEVVLSAIKYLEPEARREQVQRIAERSGAALPDDLMMSSSQVRALRHAGMQIGAHTVNHPILARLEAAAARDEIARGKAQLESILGEPVRLFAYPNGRPRQDYGARDVQLVRELGFLAAVCTAPGAAGGAVDFPFELPRFTPWDREGWRFGSRLVRNLYTPPQTA